MARKPARSTAPQSTPTSPQLSSTDLTKELGRIADLIQAKPQVLHEKEPTWDGGLNCERVNALAREAGLLGPGGAIIEVSERPSDSGKPERILHFHHPDSESEGPIQYVFWSPLGHEQPTAFLVSLIVSRLRAWRFRAASAVGGPIRAYLDAADPNAIMGTHLKAVARSVTDARTAVETLVKADLLRLRAMVETAIQGRGLDRVRPVLDEIDRAAWDLMRALDGRSAGELIVKRKLQRGPWTEPMDRLQDAVERAGWMVHGDARLSEASKYPTVGTFGESTSEPNRADVPPLASGCDNSNLVANRDESESMPPSLNAADQLVLQTLNIFDSRVLVSIVALLEEMPAQKRIGKETARESVLKLIQLDLAERPEGNRKGARLLSNGRKAAAQLGD